MSGLVGLLEEQERVHEPEKVLPRLQGAQPKNKRALQLIPLTDRRKRCSVTVGQKRSSTPA